MGRGLSDLQKTILIMANERRRSPERDRNLEMARQHGGLFGADLITRHVIEAVYVLPVRCGRVAVSRAFRRLEQRGLVIRVAGRYWAGVNLTEEGCVLAEALSVNK